MAPAALDRTPRDIDAFMSGLRKRNPGQEEFHQAVEEVMEDLIPFVAEHSAYAEARILERLTEPDRIVSFRVTWEDDQHRVRVNRAWRVQCCNAIGPYKGGMRFHGSVTESVLKFLAFEQVLKNSLTGLPMGGAKGGANFNPKDKTDGEVMRFCQSLMIELARHIGEDVDVPAGDIGVGHREIGFLFGQYKRLQNRFAGVITGKPVPNGGSRIRTEATGYGVVYFLSHMLEALDDGLDGKTVAVSGSGNVALHGIAKLEEAGARVVSASDSSGTVFDPDGIRADKLVWLKELKLQRRGRIHEYAERFDCEYREGATPWDLTVDLAVPCATQNELDAGAARGLVERGTMAVAEGANMPCTAGAIGVFREAGIAFAPGKAANAGGVGVSGLEQSQNAQRLAWSAEEVDRRLQGIMHAIHEQCVRYGEVDGQIDYLRGANIGGFVKVADAMLGYGYV